MSGSCIFPLPALSHVVPPTQNVLLPFQGHVPSKPCPADTPPPRDMSFQYPLRRRNSLLPGDGLRALSHGSQDTSLPPFGGSWRAPFLLYGKPLEGRVCLGCLSPFPSHKAWDLVHCVQQTARSVSPVETVLALSRSAWRARELSPAPFQPHQVKGPGRYGHIPAWMSPSLPSANACQHFLLPFFSAYLW